MQATEPLPINHSWPLFDARLHLDPEHLADADCRFVPEEDRHILAARGIGLWECDLADDHLTWSPEVYDVLGLPRTIRMTRNEAIRLYCDQSRAAMERLRAHAIRHQRGFTLDAEIRPDRGGQRWMRLIAMPVCEDGRVVRLRGLKQDVTRHYR